MHDLEWIMYNEQIIFFSDIKKCIQLYIYHFEIVDLNALEFEIWKKGIHSMKATLVELFF